MFSLRFKGPAPFQNYIQHYYDLPSATLLLCLHTEYYENHDFKLHSNS